MRLRYCDVQVRTGLCKPFSLELKLKNADFPVLMRTHTSDRDVLRQVFIQGEYQAVELSNPKTIIDLGLMWALRAHISYPNTRRRVFLPLNLIQGTMRFADVTSRHSGGGPRLFTERLGPECTKLVLDKGAYRDGREWATQVRAAAENSAASTDIDAFDVPTLMRMCSIPEIDLLKIDIERSELELFSRSTESWLPHVRNLCIELHGADCEEIFFRALSNYSYELGSHAVT